MKGKNIKHLLQVQILDISNYVFDVILWLTKANPDNDTLPFTNTNKAKRFALETRCRSSLLKNQKTNIDI